LSLLGKDGALGLWTALSVLALAGIAASALRAAGVASPRRRAVLTVVTTIAGLLLTPVLLNLWLGQINLVIAWLVLADLGRRTGRLRGAGLGIAAGIKLTPLIFILYLVLTRQRRAAGVAAASFLATVGAGFLVLPKASWQYWSGAFLDTSRALPDGADLTWDHSLRGLVARYTSADLELWSWLVLAVVVGVWGLMVARRASRHGNELAGLAVCAVTGLLVSPLSWAPHWVWCVPLLVLAGTLGSPAGRGLRTLGLWLAFHVQTYYFVLPFVFGTWPPIRLPSQVFTHLAVLTGLTVIAAVGYKSKLGVDTAAGGRDDLS
jgi:alpha-1,2-mannosyltransferase